MVFLIVRYINKMATDGGGRWWMADTATIASTILVPGWNPHLDTIFFANNCIVRICTQCGFVRIHINEFTQLLYKLYSTYSYTVWFLYKFIQFLYELYYQYIQSVIFFFLVCASRERAARAASASGSASRERAAQAPRGKARAHLLPRPYTRLPRYEFVLQFAY